MNWAWYQIQTKIMFFVHIQNKTSLRLKFIHLNICGKNRYACKYPRSALRKTWQRCFQVPEHFISCLLPFYVSIMCLFSISFLLLWRKKKYSEEKKNVYTLRDDSSNIIKFTSFFTSTIIIVLVCWLIIALMSGKQLWFIVIFSKSYNLFFVK